MDELDEGRVDMRELCVMNVKGYGHPVVWLDMLDAYDVAARDLASFHLV